MADANVLMEGDPFELDEQEQMAGPGEAAPVYDVSCQGETASYVYECRLNVTSFGRTILLLDLMGGG